MKKLLIITGAGASIDFGMPSVKYIDTLFEKWALEILPLKDDNTKSLYTWVKSSLLKYASQNSGNRLDHIMGFENLLYTIQNLHWLSRDIDLSHHNHRLNPFININEFPEIIHIGKVKRADSIDFSFLHSYLVDKLLDFFRGKCKSLYSNKQNELCLLSSFFKSLKTKFELGFINLNYDNVLLSSVPDLNTGFDNLTGKFNRALLYESRWNFCYHMHGSVHFDMRGGDNNTEMHKIGWNNDLNSSFRQNSSGRNKNYTSEGSDHLNSNIITGLDKSNQLLREPFASYFMQLDRLVYEADSILFIGYGFHDNHLNSVFPFIRYDKNKTRKVVVIDWSLDNKDGLSHRRDNWHLGLYNTLPFNGHDMGISDGALSQPVIFYKQNHLLEKSKNPNRPLAVWYNGLLEACNHSDKILLELI
tara:strand:+ start:1352 stop:2602 length:1251 start_codon:yes stop_codon:yes gene_type:complete